jgi:hypothetical protein
MIEKFLLLSERCAGSHFVQYAMLENFYIDYLSSHHNKRHFFGHEDDTYTQEEIDTTLFICVVRDPIEWVDSYFKRLHHVPPINRKNSDCFVKNEWYSIYDHGEQNGKEIMEDRNIITKKRHKNILELRKAKHDYFLNTAQQRFKYVYLLKYEDLRDNFESALEKMKHQFDLQQRGYEYRKIIKYKGTYNQLYAKKPILLSPEIQKYIRDNVDKEQEAELGYFEYAT